MEEDPLKKEMATQPTILAREIPWTEERSGLVPGVTEGPTDLVTKQQSLTAQSLKSKNLSITVL